MRNPRLWHFGFHATPNLPERLVSHELSAYFDYFFDAVAADPSALTPAARSQYVASYSTPSALTQGFDFYRSFNTDAAANLADTEADKTPVLYLRGGHFTRSVAPQVAGLHAAGLHAVTGHTIEGAGHYTPEEQPELLWQTITAWLDEQQQ